MLLLIAVFASLWLFFKVYPRIHRMLRSTPLKGPARKSLIFGVSRHLSTSDDPGYVYEQWAAEYGSVFEAPAVLGSTRVVLCDPLAISHFFVRETILYEQTPLARMMIERMFGRGILWAEGDDHRRQRKALSPAFSNAAIRRLTSVFFDSSYKLKTAWDSMLESNPSGTIIDVQSWMNRVSLDSIGIAGFSHDFGTLSGRPSIVATLFESFGGPNASLSGALVILLGTRFPIIMKLFPSERGKLIKRLRTTMEEIADELLERTRKEREAGIMGGKADKSIIGLLIKAESPDADAHIRLSREEVLAQQVLLLAGYETTSISLTWALIELSKQPSKQALLRKELLSKLGPNTDPNWDRLIGPELPYLDAVVTETLRLHPPLFEISRTAVDTDMLPLSSPIEYLPGKPTSVFITKGTTITVPIRCINRSEAFWGPDAKEFNPERWLISSDTGTGTGIPAAAQDIQGHKHLLTFVDGPRTCLGKGFAIAEFKAALSVLIRNYTFEFPEGKIPKIVRHRSILPRPKVEGQDGPKVPLMVRRFE